MCIPYVHIHVYICIYTYSAAFERYVLNFGY